MSATYSNRHRKLEKYVEVVRQDGLNTDMNVNVGVTGTPNLWVAGNTTVGGTLTSTGITTSGPNVQGVTTYTHLPVAVNSTATLTSAQVATGYITSTSVSPVTMTLPTGTLLGGVLGATQGTVFDLFIDNTAGASTVTLAVAVNGIKSDAAATTAASFGQVTVASGVTGVGRFTLMFSSPTAYVFTRTA